MLLYGRVPQSTASAASLRLVSLEEKLRAFQKENETLKLKSRQQDRYCLRMQLELVSLRERHRDNWLGLQGLMFCTVQWETSSGD